MLGPTELTRYLLDHQQVPADAVVHNGLTLVDTSRRNHNLLVTADDSAGLFVKQGGSDPVQPNDGWTGSGSLAHEAAAYDLLGSLAPRTGGIGSVLPVCRGYDADRGLLLLEALTGATNVVAYHARTGRFPVTLATRLATALADLHTRVAAVARDRPGDFPGRVPWALGIDRPGLAFYRAASHAGLGLVRIVQAAPELRAALAALRADWRCDAFIHHDVKWDNCLAARAGSAGRRTRLLLVDWEFADLGDAAWDTGSVFAAYLGSWLMSVPFVGREPPATYLGLAEFPLARMQPAIRAFWSAYVRARGWPPGEADAALLRAACYAGARLLQTGFERAQGGAHLPATVICLVQLAANILRQPGDAVEHLFGLSRDGR
jgi:Phosphotransferase enzyme family